MIFLNKKFSALELCKMEIILLEPLFITGAYNDQLIIVYNFATLNVIKRSLRNKIPFRK